MSLGNINSCFSPKRIINPYTKEVMYVPCRKCPSCLNRYTHEWSKRIENECKFHYFSMFVTLTYDNEHLPMFKPVWCDAEGSEGYLMLSNRDCDADKCLPESLSGQFIPVTHSDAVGVPYCCRQDVVLFLKRLRSRIDYYFKTHCINENKKIRYFLCSEYGPRTFRPHYHAIFWFDSETICREFGTLLSESWKNGACNFSLVNSSAPQYVAKYVVGNSRLPAVLRHEWTRTFHVQSKAPCIGFDSSDTEELFKNVLEGTYGHVEYDASLQSAVYVQPPRSLEMRYFPKCRGYRTVSYFEKLRIYAFAYDYFKRTGERIDSESLHERFCSAVDLHATLACFTYCMSHCCTPEIYLMRLDKYYSNKELYNLRLQYEYQEVYVNSFHQPLSHLLDFDLSFYERIPLHEPRPTDPVVSVLGSYGVDYRSLYRRGRINGFAVELLKQNYSPFYANNQLRHLKMSSDSMKTRVVNEQLNSDIFFSLSNI